MSFLTRFSMKNSVVIILSAVLIILGGFYSASQMKSESLPDIEVPVIWMTGIYPGAGPNEVSKGITEPMEKALQGINGVNDITSYSMQNAGTVVLEFSFSVDLEKAEQEVNSALAKVNFPESVKKPEIHKASVNDPDILSFTLAGGKDEAESMQFVRDKIKPVLSTIEGVEEVKIQGEAERKVFIRLLPDKLKEYSISPDSVKQALQGSSISIPAGEVTMGDKLMPVEVKNEKTSIEDLENMYLFTIDQSAGIKNAMEQIGDGFDSVGKALEGMGTALEGMGTGMQQGFNQIGEAQKGQLQLLGNIQLLSLAVQGSSQQLAALMAIPNPDPETLAKIDVLQKDISKKQDQIQKLAGQLQQVLSSLEKSTSTQPSQTKQAPKLKSASKSSKGEADLTPTVKTLTLGDIAEVSYGFAKETSLSRTNDEPGVAFKIARQSGANVVDISNQVHERLEETELPKGLELKSLFDYATPIKQSVNSMLKEALLGAFFAVLVTFVFLRNLRATVVAVVSIPLSIMAAFIVIAKLGYTINIMTLSGMAVAVGRVVDDSIVVIENIYRRLKSSNKKDAQLVYDASKEVTRAITSSTLTTIAVFGPLTVVSGIVGKIFVPFAITVVVALAFSLLVAVTVVPLMGRIMLLKIEPEEEKEGAIKRIYARVLAWSLNHKTVVMISSAVLLIASLSLTTLIGTNFLPQDKVRYYQVNIAMEVGSSLEKTDKVAKQIEAIARETKGVEIYQATVQSNGNARVFIRVADRVKEPEAVADIIREEITEVKGAKDINIQALGGPAGIPYLEIVVKGDNFEDIKQGGKLIMSTLDGLPGLADVSSNIEDIKPQIVVEVDEEKATEKGLNPLIVGGTLREMITGSNVTTVEIEGLETEVEVSFKTDDLSSIEKIKDLELTTMTGSKVKVKEVAEVSEKPGPTSIQRKNMNQFATVTGMITDDNSGRVSSEAQKKLNTLKLPSGVTWSMAGNTQMMEEGFRDMGIAMLVAIVLVFIVMIGAFGNAMAPFAILFSLPFALIGGLLGLFLTGQELGMPALIGGLMLIGIVVTNAIVLVDRVQQQRQLGLATYDALMEAGRTRIRPIFMTAIATIGALSPMALSPAEGALISKSMAVVVIGGLMTSTLLTLIVVPVVYSILDHISTNIFKLKQSKDIELEG